MIPGSYGQLDASMELEDLYLYFHSRFSKLPHPRSVAEIGVAANEIQFLIQWFSNLYGKPRNWCERDYVDTLPGGVLASQREMFGALLLTLAAEICRGEGGEDAVWPKVTSILRADKFSFPYLFSSANQPSELAKAALGAGARRLGLRNVIDRFGTQEYFETLKLQFGFTLKGAKARLSDWLAGIVPTVAVKILLGDEHDYIDLKSDSFCLLWKTLREYQRARCASSYARAVLLESPWVKPDWIGDLLEAAGQAPARAIAPALSTDQISSGTELVKAVLLKWDWPGKPRFQLELDDSYVEELLANLDAHAVSFAVDNRPVDRWTLQEGGYWSGSRILRCEPQSGSSQPNLSPSILTISTAPGQPIAEMDLGSLGLNESLLIFDLRSGYPVREKSDLNTAKEYALICDQDLEVRGCTQSVAVGLRRAYRLTSNWPTDLKILSEGDWRQLELPINDN